MSQTFAQLINGKSATVEFSTGSASTPSVAFSGDTNTGIYSPGADQVAISTNGSGRLFVDASGNVGVGGAPSAVTFGGLDVRSGGLGLVLGADSGAATRTDATTKLGRYLSPHYLNAEEPVAALIASNDSSESIVSIGGGTGFANAATTVRFFTAANNTTTSGTERVRITSAGLVGIGTSSPSTTLSVAGGISGTAGANISGGGWGVLPYVANSLVIDSTAGQTRLFATGTDASTHGNLLFFTGTTNGTASERMRLDSSGRLGIGTSSPGELLHISGTVNPSVQLTATNDTTPKINWATNGTDRLEITSSSVVGASINVRSNQELRFGTNNTERVRITNGGNVGIGTASPGAALDIAGNIRLSAGSPNIEFNNGGAMVYGPAGNTLAFATGGGPGAPQEKARIDSSGRLLVGTSSSRTVGSSVSWYSQIEGTATGSVYPGLAITTNSNSTECAYLALGKTRGTSVGSNTIVQNGDALGQIVFAGADGTDLETRGAAIEAYVDGTPGSNDMPGRLVFSTTADGASSPTERMRLDSTGRMLMGGAVIFSTGGYAALNSTFSVDVTVRDDSGSATGGTYKVLAGITHLNFSSYGAAYEAWAAARGTSVNETLVQVNTTSGQGGSWSVSKPANTTLRVTHTAGSLSAGGNYFILVFAAS